MNTKTDLIGARLCGLDISIRHIDGVNGGRKAVMYVEKYIEKEFSISNDADCMKVVRALGEKHCISVVSYLGDDDKPSRKWGLWGVDVEQVANNNIFDSNEEAVRAALTSLTHIYLKEGEG